jgi:arabinan endo-1,5-alpha-L-arabinosidase
MAKGKVVTIEGERPLSTTRAARWYRNPVYDGYFADPFVLRLEDHYVAYGTGSVVDGRVFEVLTSPDLLTWTRVGGALQPENEALGTDYWAPEVAETDGSFWLYYSQGFGDARHHLRVAHSDSAYGPFVDAGVDLTPQELFAIDPHPFLDVDGTWYLFYARDVLDGERVGTQLAADILPTMTSTAGLSQKVLSPTADWQIFSRGRRIYGRTYDWHTLEGPAVCRRDDRYYCLYSGGSYLGEGYSVAWAEAKHPLGPWLEPAASPLLKTVPGHVRGPGHNSVVTTYGGTDMLVYHAWDESVSKRMMCIDPLLWDHDGPHTQGPSWEPQPLPS